MIISREIAFAAVVLVITTYLNVVQANQGALAQPRPLYNMKSPNRLSQGHCSISSPEIFVNNVAEPLLSLLYLRTKAFYGILMGKIENTFVDLPELDQKNKTLEQWEFITKTVGTSLDSSIDRAETSWSYFVITFETKALPWELQLKNLLVNDALYELEYSYTMIDAVIRSGTKEIVGTLQHQLTNVIRTLEAEVSKVSPEGDEVTERELFKQMKKALAGMKSSFTTKLLENVVGRAMRRYNTSKQTFSSSSKTSTFVSEAMDPVATALHAYREKGTLFPDFWNGVAEVFTKEYKISKDVDENQIVVDFMRELSDEENLINIIVQIIARDATKKST